MRTLKHRRTFLRPAAAGLPAILWALFLLALSLGPNAVAGEEASNIVGRPFLVAGDDFDDQRDVDIDGDFAVWVDTRDSTTRSPRSEVYGHNLTTNTTTRLTRLPSQKQVPRVSGDWLVWGGNDAGNYDLYVARIGAKEQPVRLTNTTGDETAGDLDYPFVVYMSETDPDARNETDVWYINLRDGTPVRLTDRPGRQIGPRVADGLAVWVEVEAFGFMGSPSAVASSQVYGRDLATGEVRQITSGRVQHSYVDVSRGLVVWQEWDPLREKWVLGGHDWRNRTTLRLVDIPGFQNRPRIEFPFLLWSQEPLPSGEPAGLLALNMAEDAPPMPMLPSYGVFSYPALSSEFAIWRSKSAKEDEGRGDVWAMRLADSSSAVPTGAPAALRPLLSDAGNEHRREVNLTPGPTAVPVALITAALAFWRLGRVRP